MMIPELLIIIQTEIARWQKHLSLVDWEFYVKSLPKRVGRNSLLEVDFEHKKATLSIMEKWNSVEQIKRIIAFRMISIVCQMGKIESERLYLRRLSLEDANVEWELQSNPQVSIFDGHAPLANKDELMKKLSLMSDDPCTFGIIKKEDDKLIGHTGIRPPHNLNNYTMEMGYAIHPNYWGQGYTTEVAKTLINFCFVSLNMEYVVAAHFENNEASRRVLEKAGMTFEGIEPKAYEHEILGLIDLYNYRISKKDWKENNG